MVEPFNRAKLSAAERGFRSRIAQLALRQRKSKDFRARVMAAEIYRHFIPATPPG